MSRSIRGAPRALLRTTRARRGEAGQTLVEFALVLPFFLLVMFAIIEFAFVFSGMLGISYATRDAALLAAEAGNADGADCVIIQAVDNAVTAPADDNRIQAVVIYRADQNGTEMPACRTPGPAVGRRPAPTARRSRTSSRRTATRRQTAATT